MTNPNYDVNFTNNRLNYPNENSNSVTNNYAFGLFNVPSPYLPVLPALRRILS